MSAEAITTGRSLGLEVDVKGSGGITAMIDDYSQNWTHRINVSKNGDQVVNIASGLENKEHSAFLRVWSSDYKNKRNGLDNY